MCASPFPSPLAFALLALVYVNRLLHLRDVFVRALGGVYLIAFASLDVQLRGLFGSRGILPIADLLARVRAHIPQRRERLRRFPTLFWLGTSDQTLVRACRAGEVGAALLLLGRAPRTLSAALWALYLSFVSVGRELLSFQWDALLLENGLHAMIVAPTGGTRAARRSRTPLAARLVMRWLAFRLQFESGHCKLASRDPTWRNGDACVVHFETQPLPTRIGWHAHQLPRPVKRATTYAVLAIELAAPFLAFAPRRLRRIGFATLTSLQLLIAATGNYGFFNLLTIVDDLWLLDDPRSATSHRDRRRDGRRGSHRRGRHVPLPHAPWWSELATSVASLPIFALSLAVLAVRVFPRTRLPESVERAYDATSRLRSINPYGLFAVMTTERPEIIIEGSNDAVTWREYRFRYKPDALDRAPRWAAPHQPRLDWQLWFAALSPAPPWFAHLLHRLLEGSPDVLALFAGNPFPEQPPKYVRALLYEYHFTDRATRRRTGAWWRRELLGMYVPPVELRDLALS